MTIGGRFYKLTIDDVPLRGKTILLRADYNVPLTKDGHVADDYRIRSSLPTVKKLLGYGCKVVIISHLGRPDGQRNIEFSLEPAAQRLASLLGRPVRFVDDCVGNKVKMAIKRAPKNSVTVLENVRFYPGEEANDSDFAKSLAESSGADYFVQDGFGVVHRAHATTVAITQFLPSVAGLLHEHEYTTIIAAMKHPARPLVAVMGGAKISDKLPVLNAMIPVADTIVVGGALANTFLANAGMNMGKSKFEADQKNVIDAIYARVIKKVGKDQADSFLVLPSDLGVGTSLEKTATRKDVGANRVGVDEMALDIGPQAVTKMLDVLSTAKTVIWNGTLGYSDVPAFATASAKLAGRLANHPDITSIIGGGDTADFVLHWDKKRGASFSHVSTGGGASLELMSGAKLPGIEALIDARR